MTNKLKYFIGNWKMFGDFGSFKIIHKINNFANKFKKTQKNTRIVLCVPNTLIYFFNRAKFKRVSLGAQNCHHQIGYGSFTGSVSASMLKESGAKYVILGHSENRREGENNILIKKKIKSAIKEKLKIIFCIGETLSEKRKGKTLLVLKKQIKDSLDKNIDPTKIIFAYEPVWSIGTNKIPKTKDIVKAIRFIKKEARKLFEKKIDLRVLYGGSVKDKNIRLFSSINEIDGFLIGGASQSSKKFIDIIRNYYK